MAAQKWNFKVQFPTDSNFVNRITNATFGPSKSSGNPMITIETEVVSPAEVEIGGELYNISGVKATIYRTTKNLSDAEKAENNLKQCKEFIAMLFPDKPEYAEKFDPENPDQAMLNEMKGLLILTQMSPDVDEQRKTPTAEQIEKAKKNGTRPEGDVMKHPVTGKALISYRPQIREVFGLAAANAAGAGQY